MISRPASGFTLIELVVAITIIGLCSATILGFMSTMAVRNAEVLVKQQSIAIAASYLQEVLSKEFAAQPGTGSRENWDDVADYDLLSNNGARDQSNNPIPGLQGYRVDVSVGQVAFGTTPANTIPAPESYRVVVTVTDPLNESISIAGFKTQR